MKSNGVHLREPTRYYVAPPEGVTGVSVLVTFQTTDSRGKVYEETRRAILPREWNGEGDLHLRIGAPR